MTKEKVCKEVLGVPSSQTEISLHGAVEDVPTATSLSKRRLCFFRVVLVYPVALLGNMPGSRGSIKVVRVKRH